MASKRLDSRFSTAMGTVSENVAMLGGNNGILGISLYCFLAMKNNIGISCYILQKQKGILSGDLCHPAEFNAVALNLLRLIFLHSKQPNV